MECLGEVQRVHADCESGAKVYQVEDLTRKMRVEASTRARLVLGGTTGSHLDIVEPVKGCVVPIYETILLNILKKHGKDFHD